MNLGETSTRRGPGRPSNSDREIQARPPIRDGRDAGARAAAIRANSVAADDGTDAFYIPAHIIPEGWSYEWKRAEVIGRPDRQHQLAVQRRGWEPVPQDRHPEIMVENLGMILMERPMEITREAFIHNQVMARIQVETKEEQLGDAPKNGAELSPKNTFVSRSYQRTASEIPE